MSTDRDSTLDGDQITDRTIKQLEIDLTNTPTDGQIIKINMPTGDFTAIDAGSGGIPTSIEDANGDTKIQTEESADEDIIRMDTAGAERWIMSANGE